MDLQSSHRPEEKGKSGLEETRMAPVKDTAMERVLPNSPGMAVVGVGGENSEPV